MENNGWRLSNFDCGCFDPRRMRAASLHPPDKTYVFSLAHARRDKLRSETLTIVTVHRSNEPIEVHWKRHVHSEAPLRINAKLRQERHGTRTRIISAGIMPLLTQLEKRSKPACYRHSAPDAALRRSNKQLRTRNL